MTQSTRDQILDLAEHGYRKGGFASLSYRDIAAKLGIKSASVHYHFAHKEDLGKAVVERYTANIIKALGAPDEPGVSPEKRLQRLASTYRAAYAEADSSCLCAVLGSVSPDLPQSVQQSILGFFKQILNWTETATQGSSGFGSAHIISALQGAMILSVATGDGSYLDRVANELIAQGVR
ncbi:TetR/AcrR family transcriptional regulator [Parasphingorhabdus sp.]|uniref:TetR/AcrR family transcriptional regulator n=1 Tax=Parasphingorhabdus sp. TaxID=2709688 RepID=UPI003267947E